MAAIGNDMKNQLETFLEIPTFKLYFEDTSVASSQVETDIFRLQAKHEQIVHSSYAR